MEEKYKVFAKGFNKVLDLIGEVDHNIVTTYERIIEIIPQNVLDSLSLCDDFATGNDDYDVDYMRLVNAVSLDFIRKKQYLRTEIYIHRLFEEDLFAQDLSIKLFSITQRNTPRKNPDLEVYYKENNGRYIFLGSNDMSNGKAVDINWEIYLENRDNNFFLTSKKFLRGIEIYCKEVEISFDEIYQYIEDEEEYEEDWEIEFDADFDL